MARSGDEVVSSVICSDLRGGDDVVDNELWFLKNDEEVEIRNQRVFFSCWGKANGGVYRKRKMEGEGRWVIHIGSGWGSGGSSEHARGGSQVVPRAQVQDHAGPHRTTQDHTGAEWYGNTRPVPIACSGCTQLAGGGTW